MHFLSLALAAAAAATTSASASILQKRCSPLMNPDWYRGFLPPQPCWLNQDAGCRPSIPTNTDIHLSHDLRMAVIVGVSNLCFETVAEELAREQDGRLTYGWNVTHGVLNPFYDTGVLVLTEMRDQSLANYQRILDEDQRP